MQRNLINEFGEVIFTCICDTDKELIENAVKANIPLVNLNFEHLDLRGLNLERVEISYVGFFDCDLRGASFKDADLYCMYFGKCKLQKANFENITQSLHTGMEMSCCVLEETNFQKADISEVTFDNCYLYNVNFKRTNMEKVWFNNCVVTDCNLHEAKNIKGIDIFAHIK